MSAATNVREGYVVTQVATQSTTSTQVREGYPDHRRMVRFDWSDTPLHWVPNDPFSTHMINVLHLLLPAGERWFIGVVNEAAPLVSDPDVAEAIKPFVQQESWHAWAHAMVLEAPGLVRDRQLGVHRQS
jgi:predicted metal-dependent hydrolase